MRKKEESKRRVSLAFAQTSHNTKDLGKKIKTQETLPNPARNNQHSPFEYFEQPIEFKGNRQDDLWKRQKIVQ